MHTDLHSDDIEYLRILQPHCSTLGVPKYGSTASYTKGVALFVDSWKRKPTDAQIPRRIVSAVSGDNVAPWAYKQAEYNHTKDAELALLTLIKAKAHLKPGSEGTLYIAQSKGPCRSCKKVISYTFQSMHPEIRVVLWYAQAHHVSHDLMLYGYEKNAEVLKGYAVAYEAWSTRRMPAPQGFFG